MGNKRTCGCADVATGKRRIKFADAKCGCVGKTVKDGCADNYCHVHYQS